MHLIGTIKDRKRCSDEEKSMQNFFLFQTPIKLKDGEKEQFKPEMSQIFKMDNLLVQTV